MSITTGLAPQQEPDKSSPNVQQAQIPLTSTNADLEPQTKPEPDKASLDVHLAQIPPTSTNTDLEPQTNKSEPDKASLNVQQAQIPPMSTNTDLVPQLNKPEPDKTALNVKLAENPSTVYIDLQPNCRPVRIELPKGYEISELDRPKLDEALRQIHLVRDYVDAQVNSMVKQKIVIGEFSGEASAECQKYYTAECTLRYWTTEYPRFTRLLMTAGLYNQLEFPPIKLSDFTVDDLLKWLQTIRVPEVMEDLRPLVIHDFEAGSFQPAEEPIIRKYTGVASWVYVLEDKYPPKSFQFTPRLNYYRLRVTVTHKLKDGVPIVIIQGSVDWDPNRIFLHKMGSKMQQFVDAANGIIQDVSDTLLLEAPDQDQYHMTTVSANSAMVPHTATDDTPLIVAGVLPTGITTDSTPETNRPEPDIPMQLARVPPTSTSTDSRLGQRPIRLQQPEGSELQIKVDDLPELDEPVAEEDGMAHTEGSSSGHSIDHSTLNPTKKLARNTNKLQQATKRTRDTPAGHTGKARSLGNTSIKMVQTEPEDTDMQENYDGERLDHVGTEGSSSDHSMDQPTLNPTKKPVRNTKKLQQATKRAEDTLAGHTGKARSLGNTSKEMAQTEPEDTDMQENSDRERLDHVGPEQGIHEKEKRPGKKLKSRKHSQSILE